MRAHPLIYVILMSSSRSAASYNNWVHSSCQDPKFHGAFDSAFTAAQKMAKRAFIRLESSDPYMNDMFEFLFKKPKTDLATFNKVRFIFEGLATQTVRTDDQLTADIRWYCDDDDYGPGKRWTITPNDPDDPKYVMNDQLPRERPPNVPKDADIPLQQWQDETNWVRMGRGTMGCKSTDVEGRTLAETQVTKFTAENTPSGINPDRVTSTICDWRLLNTELAGGELDTATNFEAYEVFYSNQERWVNGMKTVGIAVFMDILHESTHMDKDGFRTDDPTYIWKTAIRLSAEDAIRNAETYMFYAWLARAADEGYRLKMDGADAEAKQKTVDQGDLVYDANIDRFRDE